MEGKTAVVGLPKCVLFSLHGAICPLRWESECIEPYLKGNLLAHLTESWPTDSEKMQASIASLRVQSFKQHFSPDMTDAPLVEALDQSKSNWQAVLHSVTDFVLWCLANKHNTPDVVTLVRKCWIQGYREKKIQTKVFSDVPIVMDRFRSVHIKVALFTTMDKETAKLVLSSTTEGNIAEKIDYFFDQKGMGLRCESASFHNISLRLDMDKSSLLFIGEYGPEVHASMESGLQGMIILRPGNPPNREYYLIKYLFVSSLLDIRFYMPEQAQRN